MISRWIELVCDGCGTGTGDLVPSGEARATRASAKADGWVRTKAGDYCCEACKPHPMTELRSMLGLVDGASVGEIVKALTEEPKRSRAWVLAQELGLARVRGKVARSAQVISARESGQ